MIPEKIQKMYDEAMETKTAILNELKPLRAKENELQEKLDKVAKALRKIREDIVSIEQPKLAEASRTIAALVRARDMGGKRLKAESGKFGIEMT